MLKLNSVTKIFGDILAVDNISFEIKDGEFVFITGPSGSGKSTVIKLILRQIVPDSGEISFNDTNIAKLKSNEVLRFRQKVGVVFQDFKMIPERTLCENIEIALAVTKIPSSEWKDRVSHVVKLVGLEKRVSLFPAQLAGGELQRGALARALVTNPELILADEPTGNLDWKTAEEMMELFEQISKEGKTILMATHHLGLIEKHKKRVVELKDGKVVTGGGIKTDKEDSKSEEKKAEGESNEEKVKKVESKKSSDKD